MAKTSKGYKKSNHPWQQFNPSFLSKHKVSKDQQKILDREKKVKK